MQRSLAIGLTAVFFTGLLASGAAAGGKPAGAKCHNNTNCRSKVCARANPGDKFGTCCASQDCTAQGAQCGAADNGCGVEIFCGECGEGFTCDANTCVPAPTTTTIPTTTTTISPTTTLGSTTTTTIETTTTTIAPTTTTLAPTTTTTIPPTTTLPPPVCVAPGDPCTVGGSPCCDPDQICTFFVDHFQCVSFV